MKRIADSISIVETKSIDHQCYEICATEAADFDENTSELTVKLDSFVRHVNPKGADATTHPAWLPQPMMVRHHLTVDEAADDARAMFHDWTTKVKQAVPGINAFSVSVDSPPPGGRRVRVA